MTTTVTSSPLRTIARGILSANAAVVSSSIMGTQSTVDAQQAR